METLQSEPITRVAPCRRSERHGYWRALTSGPRTGSVSSVIWSSSTAHSGLCVRERAEPPEPGQVVGVDDLEVGEVRPGVGPAVRLAGRLDRVERVPDRAVAERVEVRLEPEGIEPHDRGLERLGVDEVEAAVVRGAPVDVEVRLEHRRRLVLDDPVAHELDARRRVPAEHAVRAPFDDVLDLLQPARAIPPQRTDDAGGELAGRGEREVGRLVAAARPRRPATP